MSLEDFDRALDEIDVQLLRKQLEEVDCPAQFLLRCADADQHDRDVKAAAFLRWRRRNDLFFVGALIGAALSMCLWLVG